MAKTYQFIEFEGSEPMHQATESIVGREALIKRIQAVDPACNWLAKDADGRRAEYAGGELSFT